MVRGNPALDQIEKILRFGDYLLSLGMGRDRSMVVVDHVALAPAGFEKIKRTVGGGSQRQPGGFERQPVMSGCAGKPVAGAGDRHFRRLQGGVVSGSEPAVVGQLLDGCILKVANDERSQIVQFFLACPVRVDFAFCP